MLVDSIKIKVNKQDAIKKIIRKTPLISKIVQFNNTAKDIHLEYIEFKILKYQITSKAESKNLFRKSLKTFDITMVVNTYSGYSESVEILPSTVKRYVPRSCIKKTNVDELYVINEVKNQIIKYIESKYKKEYIKNLNIQNIKLIDSKSIYKPYWVGNYNGKYILVEA
ncbi:MAG: hypothetical protein IJH34_06060 [Romboutsia sp.]|nr:hypothetical protein [Romboutsia sp.]